MRKLNNKFEKFKKIFLAKNKVLNLISKNDENYFYEKHVFDSLAINLFFDKYGKNFKRLLDIGTGGGVPSLPIAIEHPKLDVYAIDSIKKKITAVEEFSLALELKNFHAICGRVENFKDKKFDLITSRAVAKLHIIADYALPLLNNNGYLLVYKSKLVNEEIKDSESILKKNKMCVVDIIEYKLPLAEVYERNLVVIKYD